VKETDAQQATALDWISLTVKIFYFLIPPTLVEKFFPHGHYVLYGASFIGGVTPHISAMNCGLYSLLGLVVALPFATDSH
jgi:hypothetical protein